MKREILCLTCGGKKLPQFEGEHDISKLGKAIQDFLCDQCGKKIPQGGSCYARSIWIDSRGVGYYEWEDQYIKEPAR